MRFLSSLGKSILFLFISAAIIMFFDLQHNATAKNIFNVIWIIVFFYFFFTYKPKPKKPIEIEFDELGNYKILPFESRPHEILVKIEGEKRRRDYKIDAIALDKKGYFIFYARDEFDKPVNFYYGETASLISFEGKAYTKLDDLIQAMVGNFIFKRYLKAKAEYFEYLKNNQDSEDNGRS